MKSVYAHFPINMTIEDGGKTISIRNFLGEKITRTVNLRDGVLVKAGAKDEIIVQVRHGMALDASHDAGVWCFTLWFTHRLFRVTRPVLLSSSLSWCAAG